jgi:hypothetical protein
MREWLTSGNFIGYGFGAKAQIKPSAQTLLRGQLSNLSS